MAEMVYGEKEMRELVPLIMCEKYKALREIDKCVNCKYFRGRKLEPIKIKRIIWDGYKIVRVICDYKGES